MPTIHVTTIAELKAAFTTYSQWAEATTIEIDADLDFNNSDYYRYDGDFFTIPNNNQNITFNGNGHTLSNIYLYPNRSFIVSNINYTGVTVQFNDLKIEAITNNALIYKSGSTAQDAPFVRFNSCTFNAKVYSAVNPLFFIVTRIRGDALELYGFTNCIFNLYLSGISVDQSGSSMGGGTTANNDFFWEIIRFRHSNHYYSFEGSCIVSGCMFNIRNITTKFIMLVKPSDNPNNAKIIFDNNAIFYSDVGLEQPPYYDFLDGSTAYYAMRQNKIMPSDTMASSMVQNCYITQFDQYKNLNPDFEKPIFEIFNGGTGTNAAGVTAKITTSYYNKDSINAFQIYNFRNSSGYLYGSKVTDLNGTLAALTTEECKDPVMLGAVGYIFAQEV